MVETLKFSRINWAVVILSERSAKGAWRLCWNTKDVPTSEALNNGCDEKITGQILEPQVPQSQRRRKTSPVLDRKHRRTSAPVIDGSNISKPKLRVSFILSQPPSQAAVKDQDVVIDIDEPWSLGSDIHLRDDISAPEKPGRKCFIRPPWFPETSPPPMSSGHRRISTRMPVLRVTALSPRGTAANRRARGAGGGGVATGRVPRSSSFENGDGLAVMWSCGEGGNEEGYVGSGGRGADGSGVRGRRGRSAFSPRDSANSTPRPGEASLRAPQAERELQATSEDKIDVEKVFMNVDQGFPTRDVHRLVGRDGDIDMNEGVSAAKIGVRDIDARTSASEVWPVVKTLWAGLQERIKKIRRDAMKVQREKEISAHRVTGSGMRSTSRKLYSLVSTCAGVHHLVRRVDRNGRVEGINLMDTQLPSLYPS
ncbi:hypothetical protein FPV67DRAFT_1460922 [Lyophyllum atratum]|nr:hypothetical protein FPV67DRAFT_1460922 [Lyophyllum atratum]